MARDGRGSRRHYDDHTLSRTASGSIKITKATLCPERKVAFFVAPRERFSRGREVRFESREGVCCKSVGPSKKMEFAENLLDGERLLWYNYNR